VLLAVASSASPSAKASANAGAFLLLEIQNSASSKGNNPFAYRPFLAVFCIIIQEIMNIEKNRVVSLTYTLTLSNGEIADATTDEHPFVFIHGIGQTLEAFDRNLQGLKAGDPFSFTLTAEEGYGVSDPGAVVQVPATVFQGADVPEGILKVGNIIPMQDQMGNPLQGRIMDFNDEVVTMDFNHPLADQSLQFTGAIVEVRDASADELDHGHVHGPGGHHH
jgi:FKBP-type peptidyl-prolyl cis-trans isomerase SlyD